MASEKTIQYKIINKNGEIVNDVTFNDYDKLADHMLEMADKYYNGILTADDQISISTYDETGKLVYEDTASFGGNLEKATEDEFRDIIGNNTNTAGKGFGKKSE